MAAQTRILGKEYEGKQYLHFQVKKEQGDWITVGGTGIVTRENIWTDKQNLVDGAPHAEWDSGNDELQINVISAGKIVWDGEKAVLEGAMDCHQIRQEFTVKEPGIIHVEVKDRIADDYEQVRLSKLMNSIYFFPEEKIARSYEKLEFAWIPNIHREEEHVCGDHFFRSPIVAVAADGWYLAVVPDLDIFREYRTLRQAIDLRTIGKVIEAPELSYGICEWSREQHMYSRHKPQMLKKVETPELFYGFDILIGTYKEVSELTEIFTGYLWERYGTHYLSDIRPQVLPFEEYGRKYTYHYELPDSILSFVRDGKEHIGINNKSRRGSNFHAWENDLQVDYGVSHYAKKWDDAKLKRISDGIVNLYKSLPRKDGAFACIYNFAEEQYEGSLYWTARAVDFKQGYDAAAMSTSVWWSLHYYEDQDADPEILALAEQYADFLVSAQKENGAIPTYFYKDLKPAYQLSEGGTTALSASVLARVARLSPSEVRTKAAIKAGEFVYHMMVEEYHFFDFETYYSCSPQPLYGIDYWTGIKPQCTLSVLWGADCLLELYRLTGNKHWLQYGEHLMRYLCLWQQVWNPSFYPEYLYGGFGVLNTDAEWNDRQQKVVPTLVNYYLETGKTEFLERAVAGCRAGFALMDMEENHANDINQLYAGEGGFGVSGVSHGKLQQGQGYAPENIHHGMDMYPDPFVSDMAWTGMTYSSGGSLAASAYVEKHLGNVCLDLQKEYVIGIDGVRAKLISAEKPEITVTSQLSDLPMPYTEARELIVKVFAEKEVETLIVNGAEAKALGENRFVFSL